MFTSHLAFIALEFSTHVVASVRTQYTGAYLELWAWIKLYNIQLVLSPHLLFPFPSLLIEMGDSTDLELTPATISTTQNFNVSVTVHNTGKVDGKEVVQVLFHFEPGAIAVTLYLLTIVPSTGLPNGCRFLRCYAEPILGWVQKG